MIAPLAKFIDWSVLQLGGARLLRSAWREPVNGRAWHPAVVSGVGGAARALGCGPISF